MKRTIPLLIAFLTGAFFIVQFFVPRLDEISNDLQRSAIIVGVFGLIVAVGNLVRVHLIRINRRHEHWQLSVLLLLALVFTSFVGLKDKANLNGPTNIAFMYEYIQTPLAATMFSTLAFYVASAAFRAFRIKTFEASLLLAAGFLVMLGRVPLGAAIWSKFPEIQSWIMLYPVTAGQRAITMGIALGAVSMSLKILLGFERSYMGGGE